MADTRSTTSSTSQVTRPGGFGLLYAGLDLDTFAAALADLATAVDRRDHAEVLSVLVDIDTFHDRAVAAALGDYLAFTGLFTNEED
ncbi:MAG TPA: hypothetical protein VFB84_20925 [Micromonosporaceae bacterium]|nr:hypothetical protein [Micromonosporaceae bacterium]